MCAQDARPRYVPAPPAKIRDICESQLFSVEAEMRRSVVSVMLPPVESDEVHPTGLIEGLKKGVCLIVGVV